MGEIEKITAKILEEANNEADNIIKQAQRDAQSILTEAEKVAERKAQEILTKADVEADEIRRKVKTVAELEMRKDLLAIKQSLLDAAFDSALNQLNALEGEDYEKVIGSMLEKAMMDGIQEIIVSQRDVQKLPLGFIDNINHRLSQQRGIKSQLKLSNETRDISGGFILKGENIEINSSFDSIIRMERDEIESSIARILFEE